MRAKQPRKNDSPPLPSEVGGACSAGGKHELDVLPQWVRAHWHAPNVKGQAELPTQKSIEKAQIALVGGRQPLITVGEAAAFLRVSQKTIRRMIEAGNLPVIRLGRSIRIHPEVIEKIIRQDE